MRIYPDIPRIPHGEIVPTKRYLTQPQITELFSDPVVIEEKIDGAIVGLWFENGEVKTQASGPSEQYGGLFKKWIDEHWYYLSKLPPEFTVWGEWCYAHHTVFYNKLPSFFLGFDIHDGNKFLNYEQKTKLFKELHISQVPLIRYGKVSVNELESFIGKSNFGDQLMEGLVVKNYEKQMFAKYVTLEFQRDLGEKHWMEKGIKPNKLASWIK